MAYTQGITKEDVFTAATEIFASGKNPTQAAVRAKLGRGSFATINKYLAEWRHQQSDAEAIAIQSDEDIPDEARTLFRRFYMAIKSQCETATITEQVDTLEKENQALKAALDDYEKTKAELAGLRFAYNDTQSRLEEMTRENERIKEWREKVDRVAKLSEQCQAQEQEISRLSEENENLDIANARLQEQQEALTKNLQAAQNRANSLSTEYSTLIQANEKLNKQITAAGDANVELRTGLELARTALAEKLQEIDDLRLQLKTLQDAAKKTRAKTNKSSSLKTPKEWQQSAEDIAGGLGNEPQN